jgi:carbon-monoxide dehydrogenase medium subunit
MYATTYIRATSLADAVAALGSGDDAKVLGGGQTLIATMKQRLASPSAVVDVTRIPALKGIRVDGGTITIGAATTHAEVAASAEVARACPALAALAGWIGDPAVRNMGTIGGSVANNDPAADYPAAALALGATIRTNRGAHAADAFFRGLFETALGDGEIITEVAFPIPRRAGYEKFRNPASRYALCGVFVADGPAGVRVAVTGAGADGVFRVAEMERALAASWSPDAVKAIAVDPSGILGDIHGSREYRAALVPTLAARAVAKAG